MLETLYSILGIYPHIVRMKMLTELPEARQVKMLPIFIEIKQLPDLPPEEQEGLIRLCMDFFFLAGNDVDRDKTKSVRCAIFLDIAHHMLTERIIAKEHLYFLLQDEMCRSVIMENLCTELAINEFRDEGEEHPHRYNERDMLQALACLKDKICDYICFLVKLLEVKSSLSKEDYAVSIRVCGALLHAQRLLDANKMLTPAVSDFIVAVAEHVIRGKRTDQPHIVKLCVSVLKGLRQLKLLDANIWFNSESEARISEKIKALIFIENFITLEEREAESYLPIITFAALCPQKITIAPHIQPFLLIEGSPQTKQEEKLVLIARLSSLSEEEIELLSDGIGYCSREGIVEIESVIINWVELIEIVRESLSRQQAFLEEEPDELVRMSQAPRRLGYDRMVDILMPRQAARITQSDSALFAHLAELHGTAPLTSRSEC